MIKVLEILLLYHLRKGGLLLLHCKGSKECCKGYYSPKKTNMEPEHHCFEKEHHLPNLYFLGSMLVFGYKKFIFRFWMRRGTSPVRISAFKGRKSMMAWKRFIFF